LLGTTNLIGSLQRSRGDDDVRGRLDPFAGVVNVSEGPDGANHGVGGEARDVFCAIDNQAEGATKVAIADGKQPGGVRVAINGAALDVVFPSNPDNAVPADKFLVDLLLPFAAADAAVRLMHSERRQLRLLDHRFGAPTFLGATLPLFCEFWRVLWLLD
jgi:hypothetical protein